MRRAAKPVLPRGAKRRGDYRSDSEARSSPTLTHHSRSSLRATFNKVAKQYPAAVRHCDGHSPKQSPVGGCQFLLRLLHFVRNDGALLRSLRSFAMTVEKTAVVCEGHAQIKNLDISNIDNR